MHASDIEEFPSPSTIRKDEDFSGVVELPGDAGARGLPEQGSFTGQSARAYPNSGKRKAYPRSGEKKSKPNSGQEQAQLKVPSRGVKHQF